MWFRHVGNFLFSKKSEKEDMLIYGKKTGWGSQLSKMIVIFAC